MGAKAILAILVNMQWPVSLLGIFALITLSDWKSILIIIISALYWAVRILFLIMENKQKIKSMDMDLEEKRFELDRKKSKVK